MKKDILSAELVDEFFSHLSLVENKSLNTISSYRRDLKYFKAFRETKSQILFQEYLKKRGLQARSQSRTVSAVRSYFRFLENKGLESHFKEYLLVPGIKPALPQFITHKEFNSMLKSGSTSDQNQTHRNQTLLLLLFGLACRVSEVISINVEDFMDEDESIIITGKGSKQRILPVLEPLLSELRVYISTYRPSLLKFQHEHALIVNSRGHRCSRVDIWRWVQNWKQQAGIEKKLSPHLFRHGCATALLDGGADLRSIQVLLGHSSIETTKIYTQVTSRNMKETIDEHHPLSSGHKRKLV